MSGVREHESRAVRSPCAFRSSASRGDGSNDARWRRAGGSAATGVSTDKKSTIDTKRKRGGLGSGMAHHEHGQRVAHRGRDFVGGLGAGRGAANGLHEIADGLEVSERS